MKKINFTDKQIFEIKKDYLINNLSCQEIGSKFGVSKRPINDILRKNGLIRKGYSNGKKIKISDEKMTLIEDLYVNKKMTGPDIAEIVQLNKHLVEKILSKSYFRRNLSESISLRQSGKKRSKEVVEILKSAQQNYAKSGKRKQTGGVCKVFNVNGIRCQGTYEKFYIDKLIQEGSVLPNNSTSFDTPFGVYYPDFENSQNLIEIKSDYTYEILLGTKLNRFTKKFDSSQYEKIKWLNENVKTVEIIVVDKKNNKLIKKEIL